MIKTIITDFGGVMFTKGTRIAIERVSKKYRIPKDRVTIVFKGYLGKRYRVGALSKKEFWRKAGLILGDDADLKDISHIWSDSYKPVRSMFSLLGKLKNRGYELLYLSNNLRERADYLGKRYHFKNIFADGIFSYEARIKKPDVRLVRLILKKTKSKAEECLFIDDMRENLAPARKLGMKVLLFRDPAGLKKKLAYLGLIED